MLLQSGYRGGVKKSPYWRGVFFCVVLLLVGAWFGYGFLAEHWDRHYRYDPLIIAAARRHNLDPALIKAVIWRESAFDASARGGKGEIGLMQLMPSCSVVDWARAAKVPVPPAGLLFDPELNIEIGAWYLSRAARRWRGYRDREELTLCEYNAGGAKAAEWAPEDPGESGVVKRIRYDSTRKYVETVMAKYYNYREVMAGLDRW